MKPTQNISLISFTDLYTMYIFLNNELKSAGPKANNIIATKIATVEKELHERVFGSNPHDQDKVQIVGRAPETVDLNKF